MVPGGDDEAATPKETPLRDRKRSKEEGTERGTKAKQLKIGVAGGDDQEKMKDEKPVMTLGINTAVGTSKLGVVREENGNSMGSRTMAAAIITDGSCSHRSSPSTSTLEEKGKKHPGVAAMIAEYGSCSHRSNPSASASTNTSPVINNQCREPCATMPRCRGLLSTLPQMEVDGPVCVLRKTISRSDIDKGQHRLLLPKNILDKRTLDGMMTATEKMKATEKSGLEVKILDRLGREYNLILRFVTSMASYRIMGPDYTRLVEDNGFQVGRSLDLWVFRVRRQGIGGHTRDETEGGSTSTSGELRMAILEYEKSEEEIEVVSDDAEGCSLSVSANVPGRAPIGRQSWSPRTTSEPWVAPASKEEAAAALALLSLHRASLSRLHRL